MYRGLPQSLAAVFIADNSFLLIQPRILSGPTRQRAARSATVNPVWRSEAVCWDWPPSCRSRQGIASGTAHLPTGGAFGQRLFNGVGVEQQLATDLETGNAAGLGLGAKPGSRQAKPGGQAGQIG